MIGQTPYVVTEWEWFRLQLEVLALWRRPERQRVLLDADDPGKVICQIHSVDVDAMQAKGSGHDEQADLYMGWVRELRREIEAIVHRLPNLSREFCVDAGVEFEVMCQQGMGAYPVCVIRGDEIEWA